MGTLIGWKYPTGAALNLADHTYVSCGTGGQAWSCWGGKTGGAAFVQGRTYGRPRGVLGLCKAPFHKHSTITGDLPECLSMPGELRESAVESEEEAPEVQTYIETVASLYDAVREPLLAEALSVADGKRFQMTLFSWMVQFKLGPDFTDSTPGSLLLSTRSDLEDARFVLETQFAREKMPVDEFTSSYNALIQEFQRRAANVLDESSYERLFELTPGDWVALGDPDASRAAYVVLDR
ncbi:MAG TPA: hypothetical protein VF121_10385 [Thermoanaerobaculia bacterium]|nr:hypothetical protein [Thermoanaerobaculia bacterium]